MKSLGNGWKRAQEARAYFAKSTTRQAEANYYNLLPLPPDRNAGPLSALLGGGLGQVYADSQGFHLDVARAIREGLINSPMPRSKPTLWQRIKRALRAL